VIQGVLGTSGQIKCANVVSLSGRVLSWVCELRYLGVYVLSSRQFKISLENAKLSFYCAANSIFGKIGRRRSLYNWLKVSAFPPYYMALKHAR